MRGIAGVTTIRVIKVGGRPQLDATLPAVLAAAHRESPGSLVVVHGGGDEVSTLQTLHGVVAQFSGGRRVTSALDLEIVRMALSGAANKRLVSPKSPMASLSAQPSCAQRVQTIPLPPCAHWA